MSEVHARRGAGSFRQSVTVRLCRRSSPGRRSHSLADRQRRPRRGRAAAAVGFPDILMSCLPILLLIGVWIYFMNRMQGGGKGGAMGFGKSKAKMLTEKHGRVTFDDVAGIDEAKEELEEIVEFLRNPQKFSVLAARSPKVRCLRALPGTGKTLLARAIAGEAGVPFFTISGSDFVEMFVGVGASRVRDMFEQAKKNAPCIVFHRRNRRRWPLAWCRLWRRQRRTRADLEPACWSKWTVLKPTKA